MSFCDVKTLALSEVRRGFSREFSVTVDGHNGYSITTKWGENGIMYAMGKNGRSNAFHMVAQHYAASAVSFRDGVCQHLLAVGLRRRKHNEQGPTVLIR